MNKAALKKFAVTARRKLEEAIKQKAYTFGITEKGIQPLQELQDGLIVNGTVMGERELKQYNHLKNRITHDGYQTVMDEAAYTWFNRFVAMRYMEVNDFLPIHMRILSSENAQKVEPDALTHATSLVDELDMDLERIYDLQDSNKLNQLYEYLLIKQSIKLGEILPNVFDPITDDLALLIPNNLLNENSIVRDIVTMVDEEDWKEVEIVGWLYQFYISEQKDAVFANLKKNKKIGKQEIGPATQLFTPRWIVEYMVDNSLGRLWLESHPDEDFKQTLDYYLEDAEQTDEVRRQIEALADPNLNVEKISFFDPSCGSGHILVYAFEVFYKLYLSRGYREREIPQLILENNLYGLDIDKRAAQLATFAVIMKAREYDRRLFNRDYSVHVHSIEESNSITKEQLQLFSKNNDRVQEAIESLYTTFFDAKLYGSIIQVPEIDTQLIKEQMDYFRNDSGISIFVDELIEYVFPLIEELIEQYQLLAKKYEVVVTNPPYMGNRGMDAKLKKYINKNYKDEKSDLFSVMMKQMFNMTSSSGFVANVTMQSWMFLSSYEKFRTSLLKKYSIVSMTHMDNMVMGIAFGTAATIFRKHIDNYSGKYHYVKLENIQDNKPLTFPIKENRYNEITSDNFSKIPGSPIAYWASDMIINAFTKGVPLSDIADPKQGLATADNDRFIRMWYEINNNLIGYSLRNRQEAKESKLKWFPYNKGGAFRKWYGNYDYVVNWEKDGFEIRNFTDDRGKVRSRPQNTEFYFRESITWSLITSGGFSIRYREEGSLFDVAGMSAFTESSVDLKYLLGLLSTPISNYIFKMMNPTLNLQVGNFQNFPVLRDNNIITTIVPLVEKNIRSSRSDWDSFETSWDFEEHPFLTYKDDSSMVEDSFNKWEEVAKERFYQLKENEEELNRIFIDIYGLQDELTPEVEEKDVTVRKANKERDVKSFLSYLVGLMFGRYSLDKKGLTYAGGEWDASLFETYQPDANNIIPITQDQYFEDDIVKKVEDLLETIYGKESLEENLSFIAEALKKKANQSSRERIREYFIKDFYKDHVRTYQKRPIYWQFTSGRRGAFKGLMYLHRYDKNTIGRLRTDYILQESKVLENMIGYEEQILNDDTSTDQQKARVQKVIENHMKDREELARYSEVVNHVARKQIELDLDDGVKVNYEKFQDNEVLTSQSPKPIKQNIFEKL
ncbi:BREX-1 system adenine-specific DNA-methyltransferase PglX [Alkalibacterium iburiense]|uniref:site-specific DNA-methyltransferase (adenine-specific) n=1 Tax=Alkalibacterium iburiense TaxID=290589 RepID=A0ABN0X3K1_9LACT